MTNVRKSLCCGALGMIFALVLQGCSTVCEVAAPDGDAANLVHTRGTGYGNQYIKVEQDEKGPPVSSRLHDVVVKDNFFYDLMGVLTLGLVSPHEVSYHNCKPGADEGTMKPVQPAGGN